MATLRLKIRNLPLLLDRTKRSFHQTQQLRHSINTLQQKLYKMKKSKGTHYRNSEILYKNKLNFRLDRVWKDPVVQKSENKRNRSNHIRIVRKQAPT
jgi:hypothetical protein